MTVGVHVGHRSSNKTPNTSVLVSDALLRRKSENTEVFNLMFLLLAVCEF